MSRTCAAVRALISSGVSLMVDPDRKVPRPSAAGWLIDLSAGGGPRFVVLRTGSHDAVAVLAEHLIAAGSRTAPEVEAMIARAAVTPVEVVW